MPKGTRSTATMVRLGIIVVVCLYKASGHEDYIKGVLSYFHTPTYEVTAALEHLHS